MADTGQIDGGIESQRNSPTRQPGNHRAALSGPCARTTEPRRPPPVGCLRTRYARSRQRPRLMVASPSLTEAKATHDRAETSPQEDRTRRNVAMAAGTAAGRLRRARCVSANGGRKRQMDGGSGWFATMAASTALRACSDQPPCQRSACDGQGDAAVQLQNALVDFAKAHAHAVKKRV